MLDGNAVLIRGQKMHCKGVFGAGAIQAFEAR